MSHDPTPPTIDVDRLARWFRDFAVQECPDLPLYHQLCLAISEDHTLLELLAGAGAGQQRPNLLLAAVHDLVLQHPSEPLSGWYPTVGGSFGAGAVSDDELIGRLAEFVDDHRAEFEQLIRSRSTQTNEVNRSCLWDLAVRAAAADLPDRPIALIEVGASAGLNLCFDEYSYEYRIPGSEATRRTGSGSGAEVQLGTTIRRGRPPLDGPLPSIRRRLGIDRLPVDLADPAQLRWLTACIWPEQPARHRRFDRAAAHVVSRAEREGDANHVPVELLADDLVDAIADAVESTPAAHHVVIANSWVLTYVERSRRRAFDRIVDLLGSDRDLTRISAEGPGVDEAVPALAENGEGLDETTATVVGMSRWRDGRRHDERIAHVHPHLDWVDWLAEPQPN